MTNYNSKKKLNAMVKLAILIAIMLIMNYTPLGYLRIGTLAISFMGIPVAVGAAMLGPWAGAALGLVFGLTSFAQCFGVDPFGTFLFDSNPFAMVVICIVTRVLMGLLAGIIFKAMQRGNAAKKLSYAVTGVSGAVLNTVLFLGFLWIFFNGMEETLVAELGYGLKAVITLAAAVNGLCEAAVGGIILAALGKVICRFVPASVKASASETEATEKDN